MIQKLIIGNKDVEMITELPVSFDLSISDIRELGTKSGAVSKTIVLPGTASVNKVFEHIFDVNILLGTYNPNLKVEAVYYINEFQQIKGDLQLISIIHKPEGYLEYNCNILGRETGLFVSIGEKFLTDINFSRFDHVFDKTRIKNSWATSYQLSGVATPFTIGDGYTYGHIRYGTDASDSQKDVTDFKTCISVREYLREIFTAAGYSWNSAFLDGSFLRHLYIPSNRDKIERTAAEIAASQYYIGINTLIDSAITSSVVAVGQGPFAGGFFPMKYTKNTSPYFDPSGQHDVTGAGSPAYSTTIAFTGNYNVVAKIALEMTVNCGAYAGVGRWDVSTTNWWIWIDKSTDGGITWSTIANIPLNNVASTQNTFGTYKAFVSGSAQASSVYLQAGNKIRVRYADITPGNDEIHIYQDAISTNAPNGTAFTYNIRQTTGSGNEYYAILSDPSVKDGNNLSVNNTIPQNIKQKDFLKWILNKFNLYCELDKVNDKLMIIEPRDSFYTNNIENWTDKVDYSKDFEILPMGSLDARRYIFKDKDDKDYWNDLYQKQYIDNYGLKRLDVNNDFLNGEHTIETGFSPTPNVGNSSNNIICPHIYTKDGTTIKSASYNIRLLYYGGLKSSGNSWAFTGAFSGTTTESQYAYMGHVDNPVAPTIDLNWWFPKEIYYTFILAYFTNNNSFNAFWSKFITEITDPNSKIIRCYVYLNEKDIHRFTFRNKIYIDGPHGAGYYVVNKIIGYNPGEVQSFKVELLKLKDADLFTPSSFGIDLGAGMTDAGIRYRDPETINGNSSTSNNLITGNNNRVAGSGNTAIGCSDCFIPPQAQKISLTGCARVSVNGDVVNFTGINLSDRVIDNSYSNSTLSDSAVDAPIKSTTSPVQTANFTATNKYRTWMVDATAGNITALLDGLSSDVTVLKTDATGNLVKVTPSSGLINGAASSDINTQYGSRTVYQAGANYYRK